MYGISKEIFKTCDNNDNGSLATIVLLLDYDKENKER